MEFNNVAVLTKYAGIIENVNLQAIHEDMYSYPAADREIERLAPNMSRAERNELIPTLLGLSFETYGHPGGIDAMITG